MWFHALCCMLCYVVCYVLCVVLCMLCAMCYCAICHNLYHTLVDWHVVQWRNTQCVINYIILFVGAVWQGDCPTMSNCLEKKLMIAFCKLMLAHAHKETCPSGLHWAADPRVRHSFSASCPTGDATQRLLRCALFGVFDGFAGSMNICVWMLSTPNILRACVNVPSQPLAHLLDDVVKHVLLK